MTLLVSGMAAGTAVIMAPAGMVMLAETIAYWMAQLSSSIVSGAPALSVRVRTGVLVRPHCTPSSWIPETPVYVLVEEVLVVEESEGVISCVRVAVAVTVTPSRPTRSAPLARLKVPVTV